MLEPICGRITAYQYGYPNASHPYLKNQATTEICVEGVSVTHGQILANTFTNTLDIFCKCT